jgi:hypothetical protein
MIKQIWYWFSAIVWLLTFIVTSAILFIPLLILSFTWKEGNDEYYEGYEVGDYLATQK